MHSNLFGVTKILYCIELSYFLKKNESMEHCSKKTKGERFLLGRGVSRSELLREPATIMVQIIGGQNQHFKFQQKL